MKRKLLILFAAFTALSAIAFAGIASAHSRPVRFDPSPGQVLTTAPSSVTGWFTSDIRRADESFIQVLDHSGARLDSGDIQLSSDRRQMSVSLKAGVGEGKYLVYWSTFDDADGEVFSGCYTFFVGKAAADQAIANGEALDGGGDCPATAGHEAANPPSVEISIPDVNEGQNATLQISPTNFTVRAPDGKTRDPNLGHYHVYLDKWPVELLTGEEAGHSQEGAETPSASDSHDADESKHAGGMAENPMMIAKDTFTFTDLEPGVHTVTVALTYDDHSLLVPPVLASTSFTVKPDDAGGGVPAWTIALGAVAGLAAGAAGMKFVGSRG